MTGRQVQPASGVIGALAETYAYDGLHRLTHAQSGNQSTDLSFDSLSRRVRELVGGKSVTYSFDDGGNETAIGYPSGYTAARAFDPLDRLLTVGQANGPTQSAQVAGFGYRGPDLVAAQSRANGISTVRQFDAAKRMVDDWWQIGAQGPQLSTVFRQGLAWTPRGLKSGQARADLGGSGLLFAYDKAERLAQAAKSPTPLAAGNNVALKAGDLAGLPDAFGYTYDPAQNLLATSESKNGIPALTALPLDGSGRNRPGARNGVALQWDRNGNLTQKGNLAFAYDFRNRLVQVTDSSQSGAVVASYEYDVFNRRITKTVGATSRQTIWQGWPPVVAAHLRLGPGRDPVSGIGSRRHGQRHRQVLAALRCRRQRRAADQRRRQAARALRVHALRRPEGAGKLDAARGAAGAGGRGRPLGGAVRGRPAGAAVDDRVADPDHAL